MKKPILSDVSRSLIEIVWHFGPKGSSEKCCEKLTITEFMALDKVSTTLNCAVQEVGYSLGFTKSGATRLVNRLEKKGYVKKIQSNEDGRICCLEITSSGARVLALANSLYKEQFQKIAAKIPNYSMIEVIKLLNAIAFAIKN